MDRVGKRERNSSTGHSTPLIPNATGTAKEAKEAARKMQKLIHDQIEESNGSSELRNAIFEAALFGNRMKKVGINTSYNWIK